MFPFDHSQLPKVLSRKAFIGVDFQNDFTDESGPLATVTPQGYVDRAVKLAETFRACGNTVIWTKSHPGAQPAPNDDKIMATDSVSPIPTRGRRRPNEAQAAPTGPTDLEAYLSHSEPQCSKSDTTGGELSTAIKDAIPSSDVVLTKACYSAFEGTQLLRILRSKMVMELFICGSLANIGVYATAIDAAGHGMAITIVEDCCGYRSVQRQTAAFSRLSHLTGCDLLSAREISKTLMASSRQAEQHQRPSRGPAKPDKTEKASDLSDQLSSLRLEPDSPKSASGPATAAQVTPAHAHTLDGAIIPDTSPLDTEPEGLPATKSARTAILSNSESIIEVDTDTDTNTAPSVALRTPKKRHPTRGAASSESHDGIDTEASDEVAESQKGLGAGDTDVVECLLPKDLAKDVFETLAAEVKFKQMYHQGGEVPRQVAVQGEIGADGSMPVYRHPSDESPPLLPFTPTVLAIKKETEKHLGHPLNHVLIQFYRDGNDYISEHSDKTIDVVKGSFIANVSLGAQRTMVLRTKRKDKEPSHVELKPSQEDGSAAKATILEVDTPQDDLSNNVEAKSKGEIPNGKISSRGEQPNDDASSSQRQVQRITLRNNSLCRMGLDTNMKWLHSIRQDKRADRDKTSAELAFAGQRISLTFRRIGTFLNRDQTNIWGQGATGKTFEEAHDVINGESKEMVEMLKAFGRENHSSTFDWEAHYGKGFDVLHMSNACRLFSCRDELVNRRISLLLQEYGVKYAMGSITAPKTCNLDDDQLEAASVKFVDKDEGKSVVQGDMAIMLYVDACYGQGKDGKTRSSSDLAMNLSRFQKALAFLTRWRRVQLSTPGKAPDLKHFKEELMYWDTTILDLKVPYLQGETPGLADCALWPVFEDIAKVCGENSLDGYAALKGWRQTMEERIKERSEAR